MRDAAIRREMDNTNQGQLDGPTVAAYRKAVDIMANKTYSDISLLAIPDVRHPVVTDYALSSMQTKFDALYIMDVELKDDNNNYVTASLASNTYPSVNVAYTTTRFRARSLNNSFGAAYFPDMFVNVDPGTGVSSSVRVPASTMVLGAYGQNDRLAHAWYAPAGYIRAVIPAEELSTKFLAENVDTVYDVGINPIIASPGAGIVVNGQRTLLVEGSALDRVNVRRLLIEVRRRVKAVAYGLLFEPNRAATIARFNAAVTPIMKQIQAQRGVERYRVQIDTTTTTQADIENNTIRGKIYLQPTRSAEFVSIDFEARNAASF
jgi:phage tail sheath protein FI